MVGQGKNWSKSFIRKEKNPKKRAILLQRKMLWGIDLKSDTGEQISK